MAERSWPPGSQPNGTGSRFELMAVQMMANWVQNSTQDMASPRGFEPLLPP